jgi:hypothetical protein
MIRNIILGCLIVLSLSAVTPAFAVFCTKGGCEAHA